MRVGLTGKSLRWKCWAAALFRGRGSILSRRPRLQRAEARQAFRRAAWLPWPQFVRTSRSLSLSVASYRWIGRPPTLQVCNNLFAAASVASSTCRLVCPRLREAAYGAVLHLDCVTANALLRRVDKPLGFERQGSIPQGDRFWTAKPGSSVHVLRKWMRKRAWIVVRPWVWRSELCQACVVDIFPGNVQQPGDRHHASRQGWRLWQLPRFLRSSRHEAKDMLGRAASRGC